MLRTLAIIAAVLVLSIIVVVLVGYSLPRQHAVARAISLHQKAADVFALVSNFKDGPSWREGLQQVDILPDDNGRTRFREKVNNMSITMEQDELKPPQRMVTRIDDKSLPFGGVWIYDISPAPEGCRLNITEQGEIYNPIFRFVSRYILGYQATLDTYLKSVARKFGENSAPVNGTVEGH